MHRTLCHTLPQQTHQRNHCHGAAPLEDSVFDQFICLPQVFSHDADQILVNFAG